MTKAALALALTLSALAPLSAQAAQKTHTLTKIVGNSAYAEWDHVDGNIETFVSVGVTDNNASGTTGRSQDAFIALAINQYDITTGNVLITGVAYVLGPENFDFTIDRDLGTATLHARNAIFQDDNSFTFFNVDLDLTWTATAEATTSKSHSNYKAPGLHEVSHFQGVFREGVATGSVFGKNQQFIAAPSTSAQLQQNKFGDITITTQTP
jgi:hypothetical protein